MGISKGRKGGGVAGTTMKTASRQRSAVAGSRGVDGNKNHGPAARKGGQLAGRGGPLKGPTSDGGG